jgi:hypothetical protein
MTVRWSGRQYDRRPRAYCAACLPAPNAALHKQTCANAA